MLVRRVGHRLRFTRGSRKFRRGKDVDTEDEDVVELGSGVDSR